VSAIVISFSVSLLLPKRYTATASIVIEPPRQRRAHGYGGEPGVSRIPSTYERFAASDTLFAGAVERFHLSSGENARSIESLKQQVLKVTKVRDTKILEISASTEPALAQQFVIYVAEET